MIDSTSYQCFLPGNVWVSNFATFRKNGCSQIIHWLYVLTRKGPWKEFFFFNWIQVFSMTKICKFIPQWYYSWPVFCLICLTYWLLVFNNHAYRKSVHIIDPSPLATLLASQLLFVQVVWEIQKSKIGRKPKLLRKQLNVFVDLYWKLELATY